VLILLGSRVDGDVIVHGETAWSFPSP
jgi:hypothetical protein